MRYFNFKYVLFFTSVLMLGIGLGCSNRTVTEKVQTSRDNVIDVSDKVKAINLGDLLISGNNRLQIVEGYLCVLDYESWDKQIHLFDCKTLKHVMSFAVKGEGPTEITRLGFIGFDKSRRKLYVSDNGKMELFSYDLDSLLKDSFYLPKVKMKLEAKRFIDGYTYVNDTLSIVRIIEPIGDNDFVPLVGKYNMVTGEIRPMPYKHPKIEKKRTTHAVSLKHNLYVECYNYNDLITICDLNGHLKCNVYGPLWTDRKSNKITYFERVEFCNDKIVVAYSGDNTFTKRNDGTVISKIPTQLMLFSLNGDYLKTLDIGYGINDFCYNSAAHMLYLSLDDEKIQFARINVDDLF